MQEEAVMTINDLVSVAQKCMDYEEYDMAYKYFKEAFKLDTKSQTARFGMERAKKELEKRVYFESVANFKLVSGRLQLRPGMLVFSSIGGKETEYIVSEISNPRVQLGRLMFDYEGSRIEGYSCQAAKKWIRILEDAIEGRYPSLENKKMSSLEKYIRDNFDGDTIEDGVTYFMEIANCSPTDARIVVKRILS